MGYYHHKRFNQGSEQFSVTLKTYKMFTSLLIYLLSVIILVLLAFKLYTKLTIGINRSSKHLVGKVVIVTGGNAGIGFETAKDLADRGAKVIIACRNEGRGTKARDQIIEATDNKDVHYRNLDLASLTSVRKFASEIINTEKRIDILINNAGVTNDPGPSNAKTEDGLHPVMQVNHLGPFLLTNLLLLRLKESAPSRIINVSSLAYKTSNIDLDNLNMDNEGTDIRQVLKMYSNTKLCNIYMTLELEKLLKGTGVTVNALNPGAVDTTIMDGIQTLFVKYVYMPVFRFISKTSWEGAQTTIYLAVSPEVNNVSGRYFSDCREEKLKKLACDPDIQRKLWDISEKFVKLR